MSKYSKHRIAILGGGVTGVSLALFIKNRDPSFEVSIFDDSKKVASRILISGNGRSNFFNTDYFNPSSLEDPIFHKAKSIVEGSIGLDAFNEFIKITNCPYFNQGNLIYPFANKSSALYDSMMDKIQQYKAQIIHEKVIDVFENKDESISFKTIDENNDIKKYSFDKVCLSFGGNSLAYPPFDWSILKSLNLKHIEYTPAICPIKVKEKGLKALDGIRAKCIMSLYKKDDLIYKEEGEILFKPDGLSGICIFNASIRLNPNELNSYSIHLDLTKHSNSKIEVDMNNIYYAYPKQLSEYIVKKSKEDSKTLNNEASDLSFQIQGLYPFKFSQVSKGGIDFSEINTKNMNLIKHKNIYTLGEMLDIPLPCGGYNIGLCIIEAYKAMLSLLS